MEELKHAVDSLKVCAQSPSLSSIRPIWALWPLQAERKLTAANSTDSIPSSKCVIVKTSVTPIHLMTHSNVSCAELSPEGASGLREDVWRHDALHWEDAARDGKADILQQAGSTQQCREPSGASDSWDRRPEGERQRDHPAVSHRGPHPLHPGNWQPPNRLRKACS